MSLRVWDLTDARARVKLSMERTSDGARVSSAYSTHLRFSKSLQQGAPALLECLLLMAPDPDEAVNREVRLTASSTASGSPPWSSRSPGLPLI